MRDIYLCQYWKGKPQKSITTLCWWMCSWEASSLEQLSSNFMHSFINRLRSNVLLTLLFGRFFLLLLLIFWGFRIPKTIGVSIPMKATFFVTYIMVDGWAGIASEILRLKPLVIYHLKNLFIVKTERDRTKAMNPGGVDFPETIPSLHLYFLLGLVYAVVTPLLLPFILIFFGFAYLVYRHQVINVYNQQYESGGAFWPHIHGRIIGSLLISQLLLMGLLSTKKAAKSTPLLIALPILTIAFHRYCKNRFEPAFKKYPVEVRNFVFISSVLGVHSFIHDWLIDTTGSNR